MKTVAPPVAALAPILVVWVPAPSFPRICWAAPVAVEPTLSTLRQRYPERVWLQSNFETPPITQADIVICADVIEHLLNPDELLECMARIDSEFIVLSTPDRDLLTKGVDGPPDNNAHVREWNFEEFGAYIGSHFEVIVHEVINEAQATQYLVCRL